MLIRVAMLRRDMPRAREMLHMSFSLIIFHRCHYLRHADIAMPHAMLRWPRQRCYFSL